MGQSGIECELNTTYKLMTRLKKVNRKVQGMPQECVSHLISVP